MLARILVAVATMALSGTAMAQTSGGGTTSTAGAYGPPIGTEKNDSMRISDNEREARVATERAVRETRERNGKPARSERARPASLADLVVGAQVRDLKGEPIGTIESIDGGGVQILSGDRRAKIPAEGFGKDRSGLLLNMTKAEFERAVVASLGN